MKIIKKGNVYRKATWFDENEFEIYAVGCAIIGFLCFVVAQLIRGQPERMKNYFIFWLFIIFICLVLLFGLENSFETEEIKRQAQIDKIENEKKIEELEKEIRLLKQDIFILYNGYDYGIEQD